MAQLTVSAAQMKARFLAFNITLDSVVPAAGSGLRIGAGLPGPATGGMAANRPQAVGGTFAGNVPNVVAAGTSTPSRPTDTPMPSPPALFRAATSDKVDCDYQRDMHNELDKFFDGISQALGYAMSAWKMQAKFAEANIMGSFVTGRKLDGPPIDLWVSNAPQVAAMNGWSRSLRDGVARGFGNMWKSYADNVMIPGLPWYPAFMAWPGPMAPPTPNVPWPLISLPSPMQSSLQPSQLKAEMVRKVQNGTPYAEQVFTAVADSLSSAISVWMAAQMVVNAKGTGPVPTFAPPYVPVGPVVGGSITGDSRPLLS